MKQKNKNQLFRIPASFPNCIILNAAYPRAFLILTNFALEYDYSIIPFSRIGGAILIRLYALQDMGEKITPQHVKLLAHKIERDFNAQLIF